MAEGWRVRASFHLQRNMCSDSREDGGDKAATDWFARDGAPRESASPSAKRPLSTSSGQGGRDGHGTPSEDGQSPLPAPGKLDAGPPHELGRDSDARKVLEQYALRMSDLGLDHSNLDFDDDDRWGGDDDLDDKDVDGAGSSKSRSTQGPAGQSEKFQSMIEKYRTQKKSETVKVRMH